MFVQELQRRLSDCHSAISTQHDDGNRLSSLVGGDAANKVKEMVAHGSKMVNVLSDKVNVEAERVKLQRQKSLEVIISLFHGIVLRLFVDNTRY